MFGRETISKERDEKRKGTNQRPVLADAGRSRGGGWADGAEGR